MTYRTYNDFLVCDFVDAFDYFDVELQKYPGQGLGLSIVGRRLERCACQVQTCSNFVLI